MRFHAVSLALTAALWGSTALAQATPEGAADLTAVLQTYLGSTPGVVTVTPEGEAYGVKLDFGLLLAKLPPEVTASVSTLNLTVTDNGDGTWAYEMDQPVSLDYAIGTQMKTSTRYGAFKLSGVFDEALGDSREYRAEITDITTEQTQNEPEMGTMLVKGAVASAVYEGGAEEAGEAVTGHFTGEATGMSYDITFPGGEGAPPMTITAAIGGGNVEGTITEYHPAALYGLLAWFVAHPDPAAIEADKAGLKAQIEGGLPFFQNVLVSGAYTDVNVTSPVGPFAADELGVTIDINGAVADGKFREAFTVSGLSIPEGLVPPFAADLVPTDLSLDVGASRFDVAAAAGLMLGMLDLPAGSPPPEGFDAQMMAALLPEGAVDVTLAPGGITAPAYALTYEGSMSAGPMAMPTGAAKIGMTGMEAVLAALQSAPPEMTQDILPMLAMAQGLGKPEGEGLVWEVTMAPNGAVAVNGMELVPGQQ